MHVTFVPHNAVQWLVSWGCLVNVYRMKPKWVSFVIVVDLFMVLILCHTCCKSFEMCKKLPSLNIGGGDMEASIFKPNNIMVYIAYITIQLKVWL